MALAAKRITKGTNYSPPTRSAGTRSGQTGSGRTVLVDQVFGDRGLLPLFGDHGPGDQVRQYCCPHGEQSYQREQDPHQVDVHAQVVRKPGADTSDDPVVSVAHEHLASVVLTHMGIIPRVRAPTRATERRCTPCSSGPRYCFTLPSP